MAILQGSFDIPFRDPIAEKSGFISEVWGWFIRAVYERLSPLGEELSFKLVNNQSTAKDIPSLKFNPKSVTCVFFEYLVQRVTTSTGATELTEAGLLIFTYNPTSKTWNKTIVSEHGPDDAGITLSITADGQITYQTTSITGTPLMSVIFYRARTMAGRHNYYSSVGSA